MDPCVSDVLWYIPTAEEEIQFQGRGPWASMVASASGAGEELKLVLGVLNPSTGGTLGRTNVKISKLPQDGGWAWPS